MTLHTNSHTKKGIVKNTTTRDQTAAFGPQHLSNKEQLKQAGADHKDVKQERKQINKLQKNKYENKVKAPYNY